MIYLKGTKFMQYTKVTGTILIPVEFKGSFPCLLKKELPYRTDT